MSPCTPNCHCQGLPVNQAHLHFHQSEGNRGYGEKIETGMWRRQASNASQKVQRPYQLILCLSSHSCWASFMKLCPHQMTAFLQTTVYTDCAMITSEVIHYPSSSSAQFSLSVISDSLWPHGLQHARLPCLSPTPGVYSNSCPWSQWCNPTISSSVVPFSSCFQSFPASGSFQKSQFFSSGGQSIGVSASASVLQMNIQFSSVSQSCLTLCDSMNCSTPGLPVHHQLPESTQTHVHWVGDPIQPSHPLSSPSPPAQNPSPHQGLLQWLISSHEVAKVLEFQLQQQSFQWTPRTDLL